MLITTLETKGSKRWVEPSLHASPGELEARSFQQCGVLCNDEVFVLVHEQQSAVGDFAGVVVHREAMGRSLGRLKPGLLCQPGTHCMRQVLQ